MTSPLASPPPASTDLWILAGQSNMQGNAPFSEDYPPLGRLWNFNTAYTWEPAVPPLHHLHAALDRAHFNMALEQGFNPKALERLAQRGRLSTARMLGPGYFFGRELLKHLPSDRHIALLPCAHGATSLDHWSPERPGQPGDTLFSAMIKRARATGLRPRGVLWYQGESDARPANAPTYGERFKHFALSLREQLKAPDLPILTVQIGRVTQWDEDARWWEMIRHTQYELAGELQGVHLTTSLDLPLCDPIHLSLEAHQILGRRLARLALGRVYEQKDFGCGPVRIESISASGHRAGRRIIIQFSPSAGQLQSHGRPWGFSVVTDPASAGQFDLFNTELNAQGPATVALDAPLKVHHGRFGVCYGAGLNPCATVTDAQGQPLPAFGPVWVRMD